MSQEKKQSGKPKSEQGQDNCSEPRRTAMNLKQGYRKHMAASFASALGTLTLAALFYACAPHSEDAPVIKSPKIEIKTTQVPKPAVDEVSPNAQTEAVKKDGATKGSPPAIGANSATGLATQESIGTISGQGLGDKNVGYGGGSVGGAVGRGGISAPSPIHHSQIDAGDREGDVKYYRVPETMFNTEEYGVIVENEFLDAKENALSTFSIDVDAASYANMRRFLTQGQMPPKDAVRTEELVNYFDYDYPEPDDEHPFSITTEMAECPWNSAHKLVHIGLQGKRIATEKLPASNLVFLIDVSGSMEPENRLPLVKQAFKLLVPQLREQDRVSIVVYAGNAGLVLPATSGASQRKILDAIDRLEAGGSTAGGEGIELAYKIAKENFIEDGNNRVILATDGDFNVGVSSDGDLVRLIEKKRESDIFLTVLGFGMGNYKDSKMEQLADKGNGNSAYIDNLMEAQKVFVNEFGGTLFTIAKDVKIQVEFNPAKVQDYRLVGYENRMLKKEDFNDDKKDAGEIGSGHSVTALYEIVPVGADVKSKPVDPLKYQAKQPASETDEMMTVKFRYKDPKGSTSKLITKVLKEESRSLLQTSENFRFSAAVAEFSHILRDSKFKGEATYAEVLSLAKGAKGRDDQGYRAEFIRLVGMAQSLGASAMKE